MHVEISELRIAIRHDFSNGHLEVAKLLVDNRPDLELENKIYSCTRVQLVATQYITDAKL